jgi:hypothetical protein
MLHPFVIQIKSIQEVFNKRPESRATRLGLMASLSAF